MAPTPKPDPIKFCRACGAQMSRKRYGAKHTLESMSAFLRRIYCDSSCMAQGMIIEEPSRSALHLRASKYRKDKCEKCGVRRDLHVHHRDEDISNNDPENLQTLCASCHGKWHWANGKTDPRSGQKCLVDGCPKTRRRHGFCPMHDQRNRKYGDPLLTKKQIFGGEHDFEIVRVGPLDGLR